MSDEVKYCNWSFEECLVPNNKWLVKRDCEDNSIELSRGDSKNWKAYKASLKPQVQTRFPEPLPDAKCPNCGEEINGVNPYDDGETWRK